MLRLGRRDRARLRPAVVVPVAILVAASVALSGAAHADTASDLDAARQRVAQAQAEANAAAAAMNDAMARFEELDTEIGRLEVVIDNARQRIEELHAIARDRAIRAYTHAGNDVDTVIEADDPLDAARRTRLLDTANQTDRDAGRRLTAAREDLRIQQRAVETQREAQRVVKDQLTAKSASVQAALADANRARDALAAKLEKEKADAAIAAELARLRAAQAAAQTAVRVAATSRSSGTAPAAGQVIANPGGGAFQCPVSGSGYGNSYGARGNGFHYGIDMMAPTGTPLVAVKAGSVSYVPNGGAGGNEAYLSANDGNVYYYAHLSQFVGGARSVGQGEVIGLVGSTGSSSAPHLHFEIRLGGANGQRINPYATLQSAGC